MSTTKQKIIHILDELDDLSSQAYEILSNDPEYRTMLSRLEAYDALNFGKSNNPYDTTLESEINSNDEEL